MFTDGYSTISDCFAVFILLSVLASAQLGTKASFSAVKLFIDGAQTELTVNLDCDDGLIPDVPEDLNSVNDIEVDKADLAGGLGILPIPVRLV